MRNVAALVVGGCVAAAGFVACVGDDSTTNDSGPGNDATADNTTAPDVKSDTTTTDAGSDVATGDADAAFVCSDPLVGGTVNLPNNTFNSFILQQSGPLVTGDYNLTNVSVYNGCGINCPTVHSGTAFGGFHITSLGSGNYDVERHVEMQQSKKTVRIDHFTGSFDQLNKTLTLTQVCQSDGGVLGDGGASWSMIVLLNNDGGVSLSQPDIPIELVMPDGGAAGNGTPYLLVQKQ